MVAMSAAGHVAVARLARASAPRTRAAPRRAARVVASASRSSDAAPLGDVTRAVLAFHEGDRAGLGADDAVVPLASWAKRFGWDVETAERVLWECDVPAKGALSVADVPSALPSSHFSADATRVVDAAATRVGLWVTHVFPDFVVQALLVAASTSRGASGETRGALSKREALDAARATLEKEHPKAALSAAAAARLGRQKKKKKHKRRLRRRVAVASPAVRHGREGAVLRAHEESEETETVHVRAAGVERERRRGRRRRDKRVGRGVWANRREGKRKNETASAGAESDAAATCARGARRVEARCVWLP